MAELAPNVRLNLTNTPENVVLVREMLTGVASCVRLDGSDGVGNDFNDVRTAVTEACNNVVLHAYAGEHGPLSVEVCAGKEALTISVCDQGVGIYPEPALAAESSGGIGLHVIKTLSHRAEFNHRAGGGTEVRMEFATPHTPALAPTIAPGAHTQVFEHTLVDAMSISIAPLALVQTVLPRVVSALAARAHFSIDRISDAQLLADALAAHAGEAMSEDHLDITLSAEPRTLELGLAPLRSGHARALVSGSELDGLVGKVIDKLVDDHQVVDNHEHDTLTLKLSDARA